VGDYLQRAEAVGLSWPLPENLSDPELMDRLMNTSNPVESPPPKPLPDWPALREQLRRKGMTLHLLWQEYRQAHPDGYRYSRFCELYHLWAKTPRQPL
jgi:transposase